MFSCCSQCLRDVLKEEKNNKRNSLEELKVELASSNRQIKFMQYNKFHLFREAHRIISSIICYLSGNGIPICFQDDPALKRHEEDGHLSNKDCNSDFLQLQLSIHGARSIILDKLFIVSGMQLNINCLLSFIIL